MPIMPIVEIYSKDNCPYCEHAKNLLNAKSVKYTIIKVDKEKNPEIFEEMMHRAEGRRTFPQIFINNKPIGGFDDLRALEEAGKLDLLLNQ